MSILGNLRMGSLMEKGGKYGNSLESGMREIGTRG
jgi:hypothetical protein